MKHILHILLLLIPIMAFSQGTPQGISYQAVAYDSDGFELSNKEVGVRISIVEGSAFGTPQLVEEHDVTTSEQGLFSLIIGQGALLGGEVESLLDIPWGSNTYFLKIELDTENNGSYMDFGTQQFMSVPYALYAESSGTPGPEGPEGPQGEQGPPGPQGVGPTFIDPIRIHSGSFCDSSNDWISGFEINVDSLLNENLTNIILHSTFNASAGSSSYLNSTGSASIYSWNNVFNTPILDISSSNNGSASYNNDEMTRISNQTTVPLSNGILNIIVYGGGWCHRVSGTIDIVGYN